MKAYLFEKENGTIHDDWLAFSKTVVAALEREINRLGEYPFIYSEDDGSGIEYDSLGSSWALAASIMLALTTNDTKNIPLFEKSITHYYESFIARLLHQITKNQLYLDYMETALYQEFSYKFCYNGRIEVPPLSRLKWSSCGGSITSVCNPHIHPMSSSIVGEMLILLNMQKRLDVGTLLLQSGTCS